MNEAILTAFSQHSLVGSWQPVTVFLDLFNDLNSKKDKVTDAQCFGV